MSRRDLSSVARPRQQGVILVIALIMLLAMTMAGIILFRQVGAGVVIARNLTFKLGSTIAADRGIEAGRAWLVGQGAGALEQPNLAAGYFPAWCNVSVDAGNRPDEDNNGMTDDCGTSPPPSEFNPSTYNWANAAIATTDDGSGNEIRYVIHRLCRIPGAINIAGQQCVTIGSASSGTSMGVASYGVTSLSNTIQPYYRITARALGPLNTLAYTQVIMY